VHRVRGVKELGSYDSEVTRCVVVLLSLFLPRLGGSVALLGSGGNPGDESLEAITLGYFRSYALATRHNSGTNP
jgi:hypothetical protein